MTLQGLKIGGIAGIGDFGGNIVPKPNTGGQSKVPQANMTPIPINNTSTPNNAAPSTQYQSVAPAGTFKNSHVPVSTVIDRQIEDLNKKTASPKIDESIGFGGLKNIGGFSGITKPLISNGFQNTPVKGTEQTQMTNWTPEAQKQVVTEVKNKQANKVATENLDIDKSLNDLTADIGNVVAEGRVIEIPKLKVLYPEFNQVSDSVLEDLTADMKNVISEGRTVDMNKLKELYPELNVGTITADKVQGESFGDRLFGGIGEGLVGAAKGVYNAIVPNTKDLIENSKRIINDPNKDGREKFNQVLLGEGVGGFVGGGIGDTIGGALEGIFKGATTESERKYLGQEAKKVFQEAIDVASTNQDIQQATKYIKSKYDSLTPEAQQELQDLTRYAIDYSNFLLAGDSVPLKGAGNGIKDAGKYILEQGGNLLENKIIKGATEKVVGSEIVGALGDIASTMKKDLITPFAKKTVTTAEKAMITDITKTKPTLADEMIENLHKFTDSEIRKYKAQFGETPGQTLNNKGLIADGEETLQTSLETMNSYRAQKKQGLSQITTPVPKNADVTQMAKEVADFERATLTPEQINTNGGLTKYDKLLEKAQNGELTHIELEDIKANFERNKKLPYQALQTTEEKTRLMNLDSSVRTNQQKRAEEAGFNNIKEINKEISKNKAIADLLSKDVDKVTGLGISDYVLLAESVVDPSTLSLFASKKIAQTPWFKKGMINAVNKINGKKTIAEKIIDFKEIQRISNEADWNRFINAGNLNKPALPIISTPISEGGLPNMTPISPMGKQKNVLELQNKSNFKQPETSGLPKSEGLSNLGKIDNGSFSEPYFSNQRQGIAKLSNEKLKEIELGELKMNQGKYKTTISSDLLPIDRKYNLEVEKDIANDMKENGYKTIEERAKSVEKSPVTIMIDSNGKIEIIDGNHRTYAAKVLGENVNAYVDSSPEIINKYKNKLNMKIDSGKNLKPQAIKQTNPVVTLKESEIQIDFNSLDLHTRAFNGGPLETDFKKVKNELKNIEKSNNIDLSKIQKEINKYTTSMGGDSYKNLIKLMNTKEYNIYKKYQDYILRDQPFGKKEIKLYRGTNKGGDINNGGLTSRTKSKDVAEKFAKQKGGKVIEKSIPVEDIAYDTEIIGGSSYGELEVLVKDKGLSNLGKTNIIKQGGNGTIKLSNDGKLGKGYYFGGDNQTKEFGSKFIELNLDNGKYKFYEPKNTQEYQIQAMENGGKDKFNEALKKKGYSGIKAMNTAFKDYEYLFFENPIK